MKKCFVLGIVLLVSLAVAKFKDYGMTSEAHKNHVGEIAFSDKPIVFKKEIESQFKNEFNYPEDKIYFMAYFPVSLANRCIEEHGFEPSPHYGKISFTFYVGGKEVASSTKSLASFQFTQWTGWSDPDKPFGATNGMLPFYVNDFNKEVVNNLKKGENLVKVVVGYEITEKNEKFCNKKPVCAGEMVITAKKDMFKGLPEPPKAVMHDKNLEEKIKKALAYRWRKTSVIHKVILTKKNWTVATNALGVPMYKKLLVYAITSPNPERYGKENANRYQASPFEVKREYAGNGKYNDEIFWHSSVGGEYEVKWPQ